jgi:II/X family phage/plasmid replication protein
MIDTMGFIVPVGVTLYRQLCECAVCTSRVDKSDGTVEFEYDNFEVDIPSSNYKVKFKLDDQKWVWDEENKHAFKESGFPHLRFEFSAPKVLLRHNLTSINLESALEACFIVEKAFEDQFACKLPSLRAWFLNRLDVCANFVLGDEAQVKNYIGHLQRMEYPRRIKNLYENSGIYFASRHNTLKIYAKGEEFKKHDKKRFLSEIEAQRLHNEAKCILRVEAELKGRVRYLHEQYLLESSREDSMEYLTWSGYPCIYDFLEYGNIENELTRMIETFLIGKESKSMEIAKVQDILREHFSERQADAFHHVYTVIVTQGMSEAKKKFTKEKLMRAKRAFRQLGISFVSDIQKIENLDMLFPSDFSLEISEKNKYYQLPIAV